MNLIIFCLKIFAEVFAVVFVACTLIPIITLRITDDLRPRTAVQSRQTTDAALDPSDHGNASDVRQGSADETAKT